MRKAHTGCFWYSWLCSGLTGQAPPPGQQRSIRKGMQNMAAKRQWQEMADAGGGEVETKREPGGASPPGAGSVKEQLTLLCRETRKQEHDLTEQEKNIFKQEQSYITQCPFGNVHEGGLTVQPMANPIVDIVCVFLPPVLQHRCPTLQSATRRSMCRVLFAARKAGQVDIRQCQAVPLCAVLVPLEALPQRPESHVPSHGAAGGRAEPRAAARLEAACDRSGAC